VIFPAIIHRECSIIRRYLWRQDLARTRHSAEQIIGKLREVEVGLAGGSRIGERGTAG
jgi:hypothetical protein